jgi:hypothetical protein
MVGFPNGSVRPNVFDRRARIGTFSLFELDRGHRDSLLERRRAADVIAAAISKKRVAVEHGAGVRHAQDGSTSE